MAEQGQSPATYLSGPDEAVRRRMAVPGAVATCVVIAALVEAIAARPSPGAATSTVGTASPDSAISQNGSLTASSDEMLPTNDWDLVVRRGGS